YHAVAGRGTARARAGIGNPNALTMARHTLQVGRTAAARHEVGPPDAPGSVPGKAASVHGVRLRPRARARPRAQACRALIARSATQAARQPLHATGRVPAWAPASQAANSSPASRALLRGGG
ncbi:MAG: hypothetical protein ACK5X3_11290, partial [Pseudomonadota bacterium]